MSLHISAYVCLCKFIFSQGTFFSIISSFLLLRWCCWSQSVTWLLTLPYLTSFHIYLFFQHNFIKKLFYLVKLAFYPVYPAMYFEFWLSQARLQKPTMPTAFLPKMFLLMLLREMFSMGILSLIKQITAIWCFSISFNFLDL